MIRENTREITRDTAFKEVYGDYPFTCQLQGFSNRFNRGKSIIISKQVGLKSSIVERVSRKYYISEITL